MDHLRFNLGIAFSLLYIWNRGIWIHIQRVLLQRLNVGDKLQHLFFIHLPAENRHDLLPAGHQFAWLPRPEDPVANVVFVGNGRAAVLEMDFPALKTRQVGTARTLVSAMATDAAEMPE